MNNQRLNAAGVGGLAMRMTSWAGILALAGLSLAGSAIAQTEAVPTAPPAAIAPAATTATAAVTAAAAAGAQPSEIMVVNLIRLLVKQGVITQAAADALVRQAEDEAAQAKLATAAPPAQSAPPPGIIRVPYVPEVVRNQIRDDIKKDVLAEAKSEGWASPGALPEWISRIQWFGDVRFRDEFDLYDPNNYEPYINYQAFNASGPTDTNANTNPNGLPFLNTRTDRLDQLTIRARLGLTATIADGVSATVRLATGNDDGPVSTTQLLGGGFTKKDIWLDQAFITLTPVDYATITAGRAPDPYMHTTLLFGDNLNFDGVSAAGTTPIGRPGVRVFGVAGAYPLNYVSANFPTNDGTKADDRTSWLFAVQAGAQYQRDRQSWSLRGALAYYDYYDVHGVLSQPCDLYDGNKQCSSDDSAPPFMQKGNTLFLLRDILPNPNLGPGLTPTPQLAGLAYDYRLIDATAQLEFPMFGGTWGQVTFDYVHNLAYSPAALLANPQTQPVTNDYNGAYESGADGFLVQAMVGVLRPSAKGDWNVTAGYRYTEPDATLDAFDDENFDLGGTNNKGYFIVASYFFANNTWLGARWFSANQVFGPPLAVDVLQLELNTRF